MRDLGRARHWRAAFAINRSLAARYRLTWSGRCRPLMPLHQAARLYLGRALPRWHRMVSKHRRSWLPMMPRERQVPAGIFQTVRVEAEPVSGLLKGKAKVWVWFDVDAERAPVQIRSKLKWGTLLFKLQRR